MIDLAIFGASGFAREVAAWAERATWSGSEFRLVGFIDDVNPGGELRGRPVVTLEEMARTKRPAFVVAVGDPAVREDLVQAAESAGLPVAPPLVHPSVQYDEDHVTIGHGTVIGVHKMGTTADNTMYSVRQHDHHPGEPDILHHSGKALSVVKS